MHFDEKVRVVFTDFHLTVSFVCLFLSQGRQIETDQWTNETCGKIRKCTVVNPNIVFSICSLNSEEDYVKGFIWQTQYNQLNPPVTLELIESIKNDYLSTWDAKETVREKCVITVVGQLILEVTVGKKMIWHERAILNLSRLSRNSDRLTGNIWMVDFIPNLWHG